MIVKNEEAVLEQCLLSCRDFVDEIIIVDTGSTDSTIDIIKEYGGTVYHFDWCDDFGAARNFALQQVKTPWTLTLDADDIFLNPHLLKESCENAHKQRIGGLWAMYWQDAYTFQKRMNVFKTNLHRWVGFVHETINPINPYTSSLVTPLEIKHNKPVERTREAALKYLDILLKKDPTNYLGLAESYKFLGRLKEAEEAYWNAYHHPNVNNQTRYICLFNVASLHLDMVTQNFDKTHIDIAEKTSKIGISIYPQRAEMWVTLGQAMVYVNKLDEAERALKKALECKIPMDDIGMVYQKMYNEIPITWLAQIEAQKKEAV